MEGKSLNNRISVALMALALCALLATAGISLIKGDAKESETENRSFVQYEPPTWATVLDGSWENGYETYSLDQYVYRDLASQRYFLLLDTLGVKERNGYVRGRNDTVLNTPAIDRDFTQEEVEDYARRRVDTLLKLKDAADEAGAVLISLQIPHKNQFFADCYPRFYEFDLERTEARQACLEAMLSEAGIDCLDVSDELLNVRREEYVYYYTGNHWTFKGSYYAYRALLDYLNERYGEALAFPEWEDCVYYRQEGRTAGGYLKSLGDSGLNNRDYTEYVLPADMPEYTLYNRDKEKGHSVIFENKRGYSTFFGGNQGNTIVRSGRDELPSILYIGYSYKRPLEVLSVYNFDEVHSIDPRHYSGSISDYIRGCGADYVVVVRNDLYEGKEENKSEI